MRDSIGALSLAVALGAAAHPDAAPSTSVDLAPRPLDVIVLNVELLRADHVGLITGESGITPNIDRFFGDGIVFTDASAPAGATYLSATAVATGTEAMLNDHNLTRLGVAINEAIASDGKRLVDHLPTIAETLRRHGYHTVALNEWRHTGAEVYLDRGFEEFVQVRAPPRVITPRPALVTLFEEQVEQLLSLLDGCRGRRFYLYFHPNSLHYPFRLPIERARRDPDLYAELEELADVHATFVGTHPRRMLARLGVPKAGEGGKALDEEDLKRARDRANERVRSLTRRMYREQVRYVDEELGRFFATLEADGRLDRTIVVLYSNHGIGLFDNDLMIMGAPYQSCVHVPLLIRHPRIHSAVRVDTPVSLVDLAATLYEMLGVTGEVPLPAHSLVPLLKGLPYERAAIFGRDIQTEYVRRGDWKLIVNTADSRELYDLSRDTDETENLYEPELEIARVLEAALRREKLAQIRLRAELSRRLGVEPDRSRPPDVVLLDLDLLRADTVGLLGGGAHTPNLDEFFEDAAVFEQAQAPAGFTWLSNAAVLTGREALEIPRRELLQRKGIRFLDRFPTLAERFAAAGYATANVNQGLFSGRQAGLHRGFRTYREVPRDAPAGDAVETVLDVLSTPRDRPLLLLFRPRTLHYPYLRPEDAEPAPSRPGFVFDEPEAEGLRRIRFAAPLGVATRTLAGPFEGEGDDPPVYRVSGLKSMSGMVLTRLDLEAVRTTYEQQVRYLDDELKPVLAALARRDAPTVVVLYANHGESLGDHGRFGHGTAYQECVRVPLIIRRPGADGPRRIDTPVSLVDLLPTLCEMAGIAVDPDLPGRSLVRLLGEGRFPPRPVFGRNLQSAFVRQGRFKLIVNEPGLRELYDLEADPAETSDLAASRPDLVHRLHAALVRRELELRSRR